MTQAFNLSQLANNVDTNGDLNAAQGLYNQVPVANGGTGAATLTANAVLIGNGTSAVTAVAAGTAGNVLTSNGTTWTSATSAAGTSVNGITVGVASGTWTKPATVKSIKVTVVGGGGAGGTPPAVSPVQRTTGGGGGGAAIRFYPAASLPGPQPYTVGGAGGTSSFGVAPITVVSATGGATGVSFGPTGAPTPVALGVSGGVGSNGNINLTGGSPVIIITNPASTIITGYPGGNALLGYGGNGAVNSPIAYNGGAGVGYGGGGGGAVHNPITPTVGGAGAGGVVIIEEFY